jgi:threonine dehydrogenase-like Zn-dependent dehydrogenase
MRDADEVRTLVCREPGRLELEDRPEPVPVPGELLVQIRRVGICGTDSHIFDGSHPSASSPRDGPLKASRNALKEDFDAVRAAIALGKVPVSDLITHGTTLDGAVTDLPHWTTAKQGLIKALISLD